MHPDANVNLLTLFLLRVVPPEVGLNTLGALHSVYDGGKVHQDPIAHGLDHVSMMVGYRLVDHGVVDGSDPQHASFIAPHLTAEAHNVGEHDRSQTAGLASYGTRAVLGHSRDYRVSSVRLSNSPSSGFPCPGESEGVKRQHALCELRV